ncbi:hypothetical protein BaRGS_00008588 [Batillaria attramentaria]|uniref:Uncharacterized protein n=1 Tax=Batillaria attramentaria TaxID=370345 RepID=A0ABD0LLB1_9CAEN
MRECQACGYNFNWHSPPYSLRLPLGNLVLAAAAFFTACTPTRLKTAMKQAKIACFSFWTYLNIQESYLLPAVHDVWSRMQERLFAARRGRAVKLAGGGRCDSPGHCAKYGSYTFMDAETSEVLHCELVQVRSGSLIAICFISKSNNRVDENGQLQRPLRLGKTTRFDRYYFEVLHTLVHPVTLNTAKLTAIQLTTTKTITHNPLDSSNPPSPLQGLPWHERSASTGATANPDTAPDPTLDTMPTKGLRRNQEHCL